MADAAPVLVSLNHKGGTGKTHVAYLVASVAHARGQRCLLVDLDQQANLTSSFLPGHTSPTGVERLFDPSQEPSAEGLVHATPYDGIDLIPATPLLAPLDLSDQSAWQAHDLHLSLRGVFGELRSRYDYVVLDCPPRLSLTSYAALCAGSHLLVPLEAADWGARGTQAVVATQRLVTRRHNPELQLLGYVVSRFKRTRSYQQEYLAALRGAFGRDAFWTVIPDLAEFEKAVTDRRLVSTSYPDSDAAHTANTFLAELDSRVERLARQRQNRRPEVVPERRAAAV
ncbi:MinD/ParA/CobQ/CobA-like protein [Botrimarina hoheduenensis]|uniref:MinD/ParA/CobQ/CobA-like protein n=2 Tax=Botrimarina hoheduenensis TaxID=2528000 RepID=A0A5C5WDE1_9BACT|nr:MinD/ParA/CobQ/CobA-like protein [Botrimarina hoheduenensis]